MNIIGNRVKGARTMQGLSTRDLAKSVGVSATAISKYERGLDIPSSGVLLKIAKAMNMKVDYFLRPIDLEFGKPNYRKRSRFGKKPQKKLIAQIKEWCERYNLIETILFDKESGEQIPNGFPLRVNSEEEINQAALKLREAWDIGSNAIKNLIDLLEDRGFKIGLVDGFEGFDAVTIPVTDSHVIVVRGDLPGDRQRMSLGHELGHIMLDINPELDQEKAATHFASCFLVPDEIILSELGEHRKNFSINDLFFLKHEYGISMIAWIYRAHSLSIISESTYVRYMRLFSSRGWRLIEPGDPVESELPKRLDHLVFKALAERIITKQRAEEILLRPVSGSTEDYNWAGVLASANISG